MSCFIVPLVQAIGTTIYRKTAGESLQKGGALSRNIPALEKMLWGGTVMLIVGQEGGGWSVVLSEMLTVGVPMSITLTAVWAVWALIREKKKVLA